VPDTNIYQNFSVSPGCFTSATSLPEKAQPVSPSPARSNVRTFTKFH